MKHADRLAQTRLSSIVDETVRGHSGTATLECQAQIASPILEHCITAVTKELRLWANADSALRWLWFIRRLPTRIFAGDLATTFGYDRTLAEIVSGHSTVAASHSRGDAGSLVYSITDAGIARLSRFCEGVRFLSDLHRSFRWAGKGAEIRFRKGHLPTEDVSPDVRIAVETYDHRVAHSGRLLGRLGSHFASPLDQRSDLSILCVHAIQPMNVPTLLPGVHISRAQPSDLGITRGNFLSQYVQLEKLQRLMMDPRSDPSLVFTRESAALIYLLACAPILISRHFAGFHSLVRTGYLVWTEKRTPVTTLTDIFPEMPEFIQRIARTTGMVSGSEVVNTLRDIAGVEWPLAPGPILRVDGDATCIDFAAATLRLDSSLSFPAIQGQYANARADHFEEEVQALVDRSRWSPSDMIRRQARRTLSRHGRDLTDIDAIGEHGGTLLLISCKSVVYSDRYDIGEYSAIRNAASTAKQAVDRWVEVLDELRANPIGDNYDFARATEIVGVVCTPQVIYVEKHIAEQQTADGLPMLASFAELERWIGATWADSVSL